MKNYLLLLLLPAVLIIGCKKHKNTDPVISKSDNPSGDTLYPLSYFPVYPGSYWKYVDGNGDTSISTTAPDYVADFYEWGAGSVFTDTVMVPVFDGTPIWGYKSHSSSGGSVSDPLWLFFSDSLPAGSSWRMYSYGGYSTWCKIVAKDTAVIINGTSYYPTIIIDEYCPEAPPEHQLESRTYYTKNIGIVRINDKMLIEYFINH